MNAKTNTGLVEYAQRALSEKWGYCLGTFGNTLTQTLFDQKCKQAGGVGEYNFKNKLYISKFLGKRVSDCYGLIKGYVWTEGSGEPKYNSNGCPDRNQEGAYNAAKEKGSISTIPEIPGLVLWMKGHAGIYIGNGEFIECAGCPTGTIKGKIENGKVVKGSKFTHWFKDTYIVYPDSAAETPKPDISSGGSQYTVKAGDNLWNIASKLLGNGNRYKEIMTLNRLAADTIHPGQVLNIPAK